MTVEQRVKKILVDKLGVDESEVTPGTSIEKDLGADSLDVIDIVMELENEFKRTIPDEDFGKLTTPGDIVKYMEERQPSSIA